VKESGYLQVPAVLSPGNNGGTDLIVGYLGPRRGQGFLGGEKMCSPTEIRNPYYPATSKVAESNVLQCWLCCAGL